MNSEVRILNFCQYILYGNINAGEGGGLVGLLQSVCHFTINFIQCKFGTDQSAANQVIKRTWGDREGHWGRWPGYVIDTKASFSFRRSVFRDVRKITTSIWGGFFSEKANFNGGFVVRTHKHFSWGHKRSLFFVGIQEVSARRVHKELINYSLYLFAWPLRDDYG